MPIEILSLNQLHIIVDKATPFCFKAITEKPSIPVAFDTSSPEIMVETSTCDGGRRNIVLLDIVIVLNLLMFPSETRLLARLPPMEEKKLLKMRPMSFELVVSTPWVSKSGSFSLLEVFPISSFILLHSCLGLLEEKIRW